MATTYKMQTGCKVVAKTLAEQLLEATPTRKAAQLRVLFPIIEERLAAGLSISEVLGILRTGGLMLTEATFKSYLYRLRKERKLHQPASKLKRNLEEPVRLAEMSASGSIPMSPQALNHLMQPDSIAQAEEMARYEKLAKRRKRR